MVKSAGPPLSISLGILCGDLPVEASVTRSEPLKHFFHPSTIMKSGGSLHSNFQYPFQQQRQSYQNHSDNLSLAPLHLTSASGRMFARLTMPACSSDPLERRGLNAKGNEAYRPLGSIRRSLPIVNGVLTLPVLADVDLVYANLDRHRVILRPSHNAQNQMPCSYPFTDRGPPVAGCSMQLICIRGHAQPG